MGMAAALPFILKAGASIAGSALLGRAMRPKAPNVPPPPQPEKPPDQAMFRRRKTKAGAYAPVTPEALGAAPTASTKLGQ